MRWNYASPESFAVKKTSAYYFILITSQKNRSTESYSIIPKTGIILNTRFPGILYMLVIILDYCYLNEVYMPDHSFHKYEKLCARILYYLLQASIRFSVQRTFRSHNLYFTVSSLYILVVLRRNCFLLVFQSH